MGVSFSFSEFEDHILQPRNILMHKLFAPSLLPFIIIIKSHCYIQPYKTFLNYFAILFVDDLNWVFT